MANGLAHAYLALDGTFQVLPFRSICWDDPHMSACPTHPWIWLPGAPLGLPPSALPGLHSAQSPHAWKAGTVCHWTILTSVHPHPAWAPLPKVKEQCPDRCAFGKTVSPQSQNPYGAFKNLSSSLGILSWMSVAVLLINLGQWTCQNDGWNQCITVAQSSLVLGEHSSRLIPPESPAPPVCIDMSPE